VNKKRRECSELKKILITGANSYIGTSFEKWMGQYEEYEIDTVDTKNNKWKEADFSKYDVVFHVAGIAHADVGNVSEDTKQLYYKINTELTHEIAKKSKENCVKQFIFMSSMIIYGGCQETFITANTQPKPLNFYGDSKLQAEIKLNDLSSDEFKITILRPPMIYGKGSKGNYPILSKMAQKLPVFPKVNNKRSMLYIDNLCEFIRLIIDNNDSGVFFPQNGEYTNTSEMVKMIADIKGHKIFILSGTNAIMKFIQKVPGKIGRLASKAFGDSTYDLNMSQYDKGNYQIRTLYDSIKLTEG